MAKGRPTLPDFGGNEPEIAAFCSGGLLQCNYAFGPDECNFVLSQADRCFPWNSHHMVPWP